MANHQPLPPLSKTEIKSILTSVRDFALRKAGQFVTTDDPNRDVIDVTRAARLNDLMQAADTASQMLNETK